jgi:hypothetical protein
VKPNFARFIPPNLDTLDAVVNYPALVAHTFAKAKTLRRVVVTGWKSPRKELDNNYTTGPFSEPAIYSFGVRTDFRTMPGGLHKVSVKGYSGILPFTPGAQCLYGQPMARCRNRYHIRFNNNDSTRGGPPAPGRHQHGRPYYPYRKINTVTVKSTVRHARPPQTGAGSGRLPGKTSPKTGLDPLARIFIANISSQSFCIY